MYKMVDLRLANSTQFAKLSEELALKPELGRLIQEIRLHSNQNMVPPLYKFLRLTPNLKIITGKLDGRLVDELLSSPECSALKLEQLPRINGFNNELYLKNLLRFKQTLRSANFTFDATTNWTDYISVGNSLDQFDHLQHLTIEDCYCFKNLRDLDSVLGKCNQIEELSISVNQEEDYIHTRKAKLDQWLTDSVQRVEAVKSLKITFMDDSLDNEEEKQPHEYGPDWMDYLAHKYPNVTILTVHCEIYNRQHIILPSFSHMETFDLQD